MPKSKPTPRTTKKKTLPKAAPARKTRTTAKPAGRAPSPAPRQNYTAEYLDYLERYELFGEGRPSLSAAEFDRLDEELLVLLDEETERGFLSPDQEVRRQELEFLMLVADQ